MQLFIMPCLQFAHNCKLEILVTALSHYDRDDSIGDFADNKIQCREVPAAINIVQLYDFPLLLER